jgi:putative phosphoesterase
LKVAALYDVHGMPWALEAVLGEVEGEGVDAVVFGGDLACGPFPLETLELVRSIEGAELVRGNCERDPDDELRAALGEADAGWLADLPVSVALDGVQYCHSTPGDDLPIVTEATPVEALDELFRDAAESTVVIGHTHHQFDRRASNVRIVNAGSIGMPYEGEVAAFWTLVEDGEPRFRKTPFDVERAITALETSGWPPAAEFVAENLRTAVSREDAVAHFESLRR